MAGMRARWAGWGAMLARAVKSIGAGRSARQAIARLDAEGLRAALARGADPGGEMGEGRTPLTAVAWADRRSDLRSDERAAELARALLSAGADPNEIAPNGESPLGAAAEACALEMARALLEAGADPEARDGSGKTAAELARDKTDVWQGVDFSMNWDKIRSKEPLSELLFREGERWALARVSEAGGARAERRSAPRL